VVYFKYILVLWGAAIRDFAAPPLAGFVELLKLVHALPASPLDQLRKSAAAAREEIDNLDKRIASISKAPAFTFGVFSSGDDREARRQQQLADLTQQRSAALQRFIDLNSKLIQQEQPKAQGNFVKGLLPTKAKSTATKDTGVQDFFGNLQKQVEGIDLEFTKLRDGDRLAKEIALDLQFADFNMKRLAEGKPLASVEEFKTFKEVILGAGDALEKTKHDLDAIAAVGKAMSQDSGEWLNVGEDLEKIRKEREPLIRQFQDLRAQLQVAAIDTSTPEGAENKRIAGILLDYENTYAKIQELARAAGASNEEAAQLAADAWKKSLGDINNKTDELTAFQTRAFERMQDEFANLFKDALSGNIKSVGDAVKRLQSFFTSQVAEFAAMQAKVAIFGADYGKAGGQMGGVLGQIFGAGRTALPTGFGERPQGVEGPLLPNGGFFSGPQGAEKNPIATLFKEGAPDIIAPMQAALGDVSRFFSDDLGDVFKSTTKFFEQQFSSVIQQLAIDFAAATATNSSSGGGGGGGFLGMFSGLFGGSSSGAADAGAASEGGGLVASMGYHQGGLIGKLHGGGLPSDFATLDLSGAHGEAAQRIMKQLAGLKPDERVIVAQDGEYMLSKDAVRIAGVKNIAALNEMRASIFPRRHDGGAIGDLPTGFSLPRLSTPDLSYMKEARTPDLGRLRADRGAGGGSNHTTIHVNINSPDVDGFRRSQAQIYSHIAQIVDKGNKYR
jgi:hypothetical protein